MQGVDEHATVGGGARLVDLDDVGQELGDALHQLVHQADVVVVEVDEPGGGVEAGGGALAEHHGLGLDGLDLEESVGQRLGCDVGQTETEQVVFQVLVGHAEVLHHGVALGVGELQLDVGVGVAFLVVLAVAEEAPEQAVATEQAAAVAAAVAAQLLGPHGAGSAFAVGQDAAAAAVAADQATDETVAAFLFAEQAADKVAAEQAAAFARTAACFLVLGVEDGADGGFEPGVGQHAAGGAEDQLAGLTHAEDLVFNRATRGQERLGFTRAIDQRLVAQEARAQLDAESAGAGRLGRGRGRVGDPERTHGDDARRY